MGVEVSHEHDSALFRLVKSDVFFEAGMCFSDYFERFTHVGEIDRGYIQVWDVITTFDSSPCVTCIRRKAGGFNAERHKVQYLGWNDCVVNQTDKNAILPDIEV